MGPGERIARAGLRQARRAVAVITGVTVVLAGLLMLVTPGPGLLGIWLGLAILATEFAWAKRVLVRARGLARQAGDRVMGRRPGDGEELPSVPSSHADPPARDPAGRD